VSEPVNLAYLCHHYGEAYEVNMRRGRYEARRRDDGTVLTADSADALLDVIRADYAARPVPRDPRPCRFLGPGRPDQLDLPDGGDGAAVPR
jgi:hypothetical protein